MTGSGAASWRTRLLMLVLALGAAGALLAWLAVSLVHLDDRERVGHVQGSWMALAQYLNEGTLYPPVFDGERYGGTRWMPLGIVLNAGAARVAGSELVGGKALTLLLTVAFLVVSAGALRRLRCPWPVAAALLSAVVATRAGLFTTTTIGGDVLPVLLQVMAIMVVLRAGTRRNPWGALVGAGALAGLAPVAKLTAGWAALAIVCHFAAARRWRELAVFAAATAGTAAAGVGLALIVSDGRLWDSVGRFMFAGGTGVFGLVRAPNQVLFNVTEFAPGLLAVAPLALGAVLLTRGWHSLSLLDWALGWAVLGLLATFTDVGTGLNQVLDILVLLVLVAAQLPDRLAATLNGRGQAVGTGALAVAALVALAAGTVVSLVPAVRTAVDVARHGHPLPTVPLADVITPTDTILSEDPYAAVALGRQPVVLDAFMIRRLNETRPELVNPLIEWIDAARFDYVLLSVEDLSEDAWWEVYHFGPRVVEALRASYELVEWRDGYAVYRPRR